MRDWVKKSFKVCASKKSLEICTTPQASKSCVYSGLMFRSGAFWPRYIVKSYCYWHLVPKCISFSTLFWKESWLCLEAQTNAQTLIRRPPNARHGILLYSFCQMHFYILKANIQGGLYTFWRSSMIFVVKLRIAWFVLIRMFEFPWCGTTIL